jgi:outer membrane cobalamin receptor
LSKLVIFFVFLFLISSELFAQVVLDDLYAPTNLLMEGGQRAQGAELKEALSRVGGVQVWEDPLSGQPQVSIRGSRNSHLNIYVDDILVTNSMGTSEQSLRLPMEMIESIVIYKENVPIKYQSAIGGVIVIKTKTNSSLASFTAGSFDTYKTDVLFSKKVFKNDKISAWGFFERSQNDYPYLDKAGTQLNEQDDFKTRRKNAEKKNEGMGARYEKNLSSQKIVISGGYLENDSNLPPSSSLINGYANLLERQKTIAGKWSYQKDQYGLNFNIANVDKRINYSDEESTLSLSPLKSKTKIESTPIEAGASYSMGDFIFKPQLFFRNQKLSSWQNFTPEKINRDEKSYGAEINYLKNNWEISLAGKRLEYDDKGRVNQSDDAFQHSFGIGYHWKKSALKFSSAFVATFPELWQIQGDRGYLRSNANLKSEQRHQYDLGYQFQFETFDVKWQMLARVFYKTMKDGIFIIYNSQGVGIAQNIAEGEITGAEYEVTGDWQNFNLGLTYTYQQALNRTKSAIYDDKFLPNIYEHDFQTNLSYTYQKFIFSYRFYYLYNMYYDDVNLLPAKPYEGHDLSVRWKSVKSIWGISLRNIFDQRIETANGLEGRGRSFEVTYQFLF